MSCNLNRLKVTMGQMDRLIHALDDLHEDVLPKAPVLFATMAEGPLDDLEHLRREIRDRVNELQPTGRIGKIHSSSEITAHYLRIEREQSFCTPPER